MTISEQAITLLKEKRGWTDDILRQLKNPLASDQHDPFLLENVSAFIKQLHTYKENHITIIPDYDADGILSGSLLMASLSALGFEHIALYEPRIQTGYGMTARSTKEAIGRFPDTEVILTTDNGSNAHEGVNYALEQGLDVLITDHHQADSGDPVSLVVNPNRPTDEYPNKGLSGAAVVWKVMQAYASTYGTERQQRLIDLLIVLVGMSIISDVMPLLDENRYFVAQAIAMLQQPTLLNQGAQVDGVYGDVFSGLLALYTICYNNDKFNYGFDESTLGFVFGPMLNSPRRMSGSSKQGFNVFLSTSYEDAYAAAETLFGTNEERKALMREYNQAYLSPILSSQQPLDYMLGVVNYRPGLIGLLAGRFTSQYQLPSIVFGHRDLRETHYQGTLPSDLDVISGSGRSPEWFDLHGALTQIFDEHPDWVTSFGGHKQAAGVGIYAKHYEDFRQRFTALVVQRLEEYQQELVATPQSEDLTVWLGYKQTAAQPFDIVLKEASDVQQLIPVVDFIEELKPFGQGFSEPDFGVRFNTNDVEVFFMGSDKQHVKFTLPNGLVVIQWNGSEALRKQLGQLNGPFKLSARGPLGINEFRGNKTVQMIADHVTIEN